MGGLPIVYPFHLSAAVDILPGETLTLKQLHTKKVTMKC